MGWLEGLLMLGGLGYMASQMAKAPSLPSIETAIDIPMPEDEDVGIAAESARDKAKRAYGQDDTNLTSGLGLTPLNRKRIRGR